MNPTIPRQDLKLLDRQDVAELLGVCVRTLAKIRKQEDFPEPKVKSGKPYWTLAQIQTWSGQGSAELGKDGQTTTGDTQ